MMFLGKERRQRPAVHLQGHSCTKPLHPLGLPPPIPLASSACRLPKVSRVPRPAECPLHAGALCWLAALSPYL